MDNDEPLMPFMKDFEEIQKGIEQLDIKCAHEQMNIQKQYDVKKKPLFEKREEIIEKVPRFWANTLRKHPALSDIVPEDIEILNCLVKLDLKDNMDNNGSYKITFTFNEKAKEYMEPLILVKHVTFDNNQEKVVECTRIKWKDGKNPIEYVCNNRCDLDNEMPKWSFFEWFTTEELQDKPDVGELIRREIWHNPLAYYLGLDDFDDFEEDFDEEFDDDDDDDDDDEDDEDDEDEEDEDEEDDKDDDDEKDDDDMDGDDDGKDDENDD
ncbi:aspartic acid-rich protein [Plasmodium inui San Antonio 1]|uniref:Aspartic acid-rich protein n=1 Tax=Plasmodium inui San Antonio 1 TaxID=1237626 RepID=W7A426_9APIC|nr:aspartic acid-rich protein [Plasmodium inui San Antonio 1]EUD68012.1 aspartic acid-rich protein [Plasmodium inui San Antonio 1]